MRIVTIVFMIIAAGLAIFNLTKVNYSNLFEDDSVVALIGVVASLIAIVILLIFNTAKSIQQKLK